MAGSSSNSLKATWVATQLSGRISSRLSGVFAARLWFTPWRVPVGERGLAKQAHWLEPTEPLVLETDWGPLPGFSAGTGPNVLLVHGWGERAAFLGAFIQPLIESGFRVTGVDLPGHGDAPAGRRDLFELAEAVTDIAGRLGGVQAIVAHSMGGTVSSLAISRGLGVDAIALVAPASEPEHVVDKFRLMFSLPPRAVRGLIDRIERDFGSDVWDRLRIARLAADFDTPALIVHDATDEQIDVADSKALADAWPQARLMITEGLGHDKIARDPAVVQTITSFLQESIPRTGSPLVAASSSQI